MTKYRQILNQMHEAGIEFSVNVEIPRGGKEMALPPNHVLEYLQDPAAWKARQLGCSKTDYLEWLENDGTAWCVSTTKTGQPCKNSVRGGIQLPIDEWLANEQDYCPVHGGLGKRDN